jgi:hypothetical protein
MDLDIKTNQEVLKALGRGIRQAPEFRGQPPLSADIEQSMKALEHLESVNFGGRPPADEEDNSDESDEGV